MAILAHPVHPEEILKEDFLDPLSLAAGKLAKALNVPRTRIERIVSGARVVSPDTALRLSRHFGTSPELWLDLQRGYDLASAAQDKQLSQDLEGILPMASQCLPERPSRNLLTTAFPVGTLLGGTCPTTAR